jgi:thiosulfate/3-mercaptopyruvate sulfurtransferase
VKNHPLYPEVLVETSAVEHLIRQTGVKIVEADLDPTAFDIGHIETAILWDWEGQLRDPVTYEILTRTQMEALLGESGISNTDTILLYGDHNNWFACWAFWLLKLYGHENVYLIDGGAKKWFAEERPVTTGSGEIRSAQYTASNADLTNKAAVEDIFITFFEPGKHTLVDVRSSYEYEGKSLGPAGVEARCAVAGHIPTAINIPWNLNCNEDGTFKEVEELIDLYSSFGVTRDTSVITYCAIGERASLSWFVLKYLLKHPRVMNYDRSMAEWSRMQNAPLVTGSAA